MTDQPTVEEKGPAQMRAAHAGYKLGLRVITVALEFAAGNDTGKGFKLAGETLSELIEINHWDDLEALAAERGYRAAYDQIRVMNRLVGGDVAALQTITETLTATADLLLDCYV